MIKIKLFSGKRKEGRTHMSDDNNKNTKKRTQKEPGCSHSPNAPRSQNADPEAFASMFLSQLFGNGQGVTPSASKDWDNAVEDLKKLASSPMTTAVDCSDGIRAFLWLVTKEGARVGGEATKKDREADLKFIRQCTDALEELKDCNDAMTFRKVYAKLVPAYVFHKEVVQQAVHLLTHKIFNELAKDILLGQVATDETLTKKQKVQDGDAQEDAEGQKE